MSKLTRMEKIAQHQLEIENALRAMYENPPDPDRFVELSKEIRDASVELVKQSRKFRKEVKKETEINA